jgi:hypothetical protein
MRNLILFGLLALLTFAVACGGDDDDDSGGDDRSATSPAAASATTADDVGVPATIASENFSPAVTAEVGASWVVEIDEPGIFVLRHDQDEEGPLGYIAVSYPRKVWSYDGLVQEDVPEDFVSWVRAHPRLTILGEQPVTVGALSGTQLEIAANQPSDFSFLDDDGGTFDVNYSDHFILTIFETSEGPLANFIGPEQATRFDAFVAVAQPVLDTMEFEE